MKKIIAWKVHEFSYEGDFGGYEADKFFHNEDNARAYFKKSDYDEVELSYIDEQLVEHFVLKEDYEGRQEENYEMSQIEWED